MKRLSVDGFYSWSTFDERRGVDMHGHLWARDDGCVAFDPPVMSDADRQHLAELGGLRTIVLTGSRHERDAATLREHTGAEVVAHELAASHLSFAPGRTVADGEEIVDGLRAVRLAGGACAGTMAADVLDRGAFVVGDPLVGSPAGSVSLVPDADLADPPRAVLALRALLRHEPQTLLLGAGDSVYHGAYDRLLDCLEARTDVYINRINVSELDAGSQAEIGGLIGARDLGYQLFRLEPGEFNCPFHFHHFDEEMAYVMEGECVMRTDRGEFTIREGDFIAFRAGPRGVHKFVNRSAARCVLFVLGEQHPHLICEYPDSEKIATYVVNGAFRKRDVVGYWDGEGHPD